jgi:hypothetical protein
MFEVDSRQTASKQATGDPAAKSHFRCGSWLCENTSDFCVFTQPGSFATLSRCPRRGPVHPPTSDIRLTVRDGSEWNGSAALRPNVLAVALANKLARIAWTVLAQERGYEARVASIESCDRRIRRTVTCTCWLDVICVPNSFSKVNGRLREKCRHE